MRCGCDGDGGLIVCTDGVKGYGLEACGQTPSFLKAEKSSPVSLTAGHGLHLAVPWEAYQREEKDGARWGSMIVAKDVREERTEANVASQPASAYVWPQHPPVPSDTIGTCGVRFHRRHIH